MKTARLREPWGVAVSAIRGTDRREIRPAHKRKKARVRAFERRVSCSSVGAICSTPTSDALVAGLWIIPRYRMLFKASADAPHPATDCRSKSSTPSPILGTCGRPGRTAKLRR